MNLVDSSGWLEYLADDVNAGFFASAIERPADLIVPSLSIYEVFKKVLTERNEDDALQAVALMQQGLVVALDGHLALMAAKLSVAHRLPMADSVMLATANLFQATLWSQDADFAAIDGVRYISKSKSPRT